jgi:hypothetical protein
MSTLAVAIPFSLLFRPHMFNTARPLTIAAAAATVLLSTLSAHAAGFGDLGGRFDFSFADSNGLPSDVPQSVGQQTAPNGQSVKLFGSMGPIDGARFRSGFVFYWSGPYEGPVLAGETFSVDLDFDVDVTGGTLEWSFFADLYEATDSGTDHARIQTGLMPLPAPHAVSTHLESSPFPVDGQGFHYSSYLHFDWSGYAPTDTFSLTVPPNSVDVTYIPEPLAAAVTAPLAVTALALRLRPAAATRRRTCRRSTRHWA